VVATTTADETGGFGVKVPPQGYRPAIALTGFSD
jgi:hypothetical protein